MSVAATTQPSITELIGGAGKPEPASRLTGFVPASIPTEQAPKISRASTGDLAIDAYKAKWSVSFALNQLDRLSVAPDPNFKGAFADAESIKRYTFGLDPSFWPALAHASSDDEAQVIHGQMQERQRATIELANGGWRGAALGFVAEMTDPAMIALGAVTGGGAWASKGVLAARMAKHGLIAAGSTVPFEAYMMSQDPQRDTGDAMRAVAGSFVLGAGLSAIGSALKFHKAAQAIQDDAIVHDMVGANWSMGASSPGEFWSPEVRAKLRDQLLTEEGRVRFKDGLSPESKQSTVDMLIQGSNLDPELHADAIESLRSLDPDTMIQRYVPPEQLQDIMVAPSALEVPKTELAGTGADANEVPGGPAKAAADGAATPPIPPKDEFGFQPKHVSSARADLANARLDIASLLGNSENPTMRMALRYSAQDALLAKEASGATKGQFVPATDSATEWIRREYRRQIGNLAITYNNLSDRFYEANGGTWLKAGSLKRQFDESVTRAIRSDDAYKLATGAVKEAADLGRKHSDYVLQMAQSHGLEDALGLKSNANYMTRIWSRAAITKLQSKYGEEFVNSLLSDSVRSMYPNMSVSVSDDIAKGMLGKIMRYGERLDLDNARLHNMGPEALRDILTNEVKNITPQEIDRILEQAVPADHAGVSTNRLRDRAVLDENFSKPAPDGSYVQLQDMLENNFPKLVSLYTRQMLGASAEQEMLRGISAATGKKLRSYEDLRGFIEKEMFSMGMTKSQMTKELSTLDIVRGHVRGMPTGTVLGGIKGDSDAAKILRIIRAYNYVRSSGGFGISQVPELAGAMAEPGMQVLTQQMPVLADVFSRAKNGKLTNEFLAECEAIWASGTDHHIEQFAGHLDDYGTDFEVARSKLERGLHQLNRRASIASGFTAIDSLSRKWAAVAAVQRLANMAAGRKVSLKRLYELGLTPEKAQRVFDQINNPNVVDTVQGAFGKKVKRINFDKWTDPQAKADFIVAVDKYANRLVQTNDIGSTNRFMTDELGKTISQFRSFVANGWSKNTLHRLQMHDEEAARGALASWIAGSLAFVGQTYVQSLGRQDAEKFRKDRLTPGSIAAVGWARSGWASVLPGVIDNGLSIGGFDPLFKFGRYSGLDTTGILQNPSVQLGNSAIKTASAGVKLLRSAAGGKDHRLTRAEAQSFMNLLPFGRVVGVQNFLDSFVTSRPKQ